MNRPFLTTLLLAFALSPAFAATPWGADYFPNTALTNDRGEEVRFFDDLIKDKVVLVNFIYTRCVDTCPLETAQLVKVQSILGERLGKDVHFYSISIDPEHDTPEVLAEYRERFRANWSFYTGDEADIITLRRKLGLYVEEIQDDSGNHNVNMIIGNQSTGRWMKRSPFENPYVLADQLGNWLTDWKSPQPKSDYADAPKLRNMPNGETLFRTRCAVCHTVDGTQEHNALGPDLLGVTERREAQWLLDWLRAPDQMLANKDPIAMALFAEYNELAMPNMRLNEKDARDLLSYLDSESTRQTGPVARAGGDQVAIKNAWIRATDAKAKANAGYLTFVNDSGQALTVERIDCAAFDKVEMHEMSMVDGMMKMSELEALIVPAGGQVKFSPGGKHLMLIGPRKHQRSGDSVKLVLNFANGSEQTVWLGVEDR